MQGFRFGVGVRRFAFCARRSAFGVLACWRKQLHGRRIFVAFDVHDDELAPWERHTARLKALNAIGS